MGAINLSGIVGVDVNPSKSIGGITKIDLGTLWNIAFGYRGMPIIFPYRRVGNYLTNKNFKNESVQFPSREGINEGYAPVYTTDPSNGNMVLFLPIWINDELIPVARVYGGCKKVIVKTPLIARRGKVNELIRFDDYEFTIQGMCVGLKKEYPDSQISKINSLFNLKEPVKIKNAFIDTLVGTEDFIIEELDFPDMRGVEHVKAFTMKITADSIFDLTEV